MRKSLASLTLIGMVASDVAFQATRRSLFAKCRLVTKGLDGRAAYVDIYAIGEAAQLMNLICQRGDVVLITAIPFSKTFLEGDKVSARLLFFLEDAETLRKAKKPAPIPYSRIERIIDSLDPQQVIGEDWEDTE